MANSDAGKRLQAQSILAKRTMPLAELDKVNTYTAQPNTTAFTVGNADVPGSVDRKITGSSPFDIQHMSYVTDKGRVVNDMSQLQPGEKVVMTIPGKSSKGYTAAMFEEGMPNPGFGVGGAAGPVNLGGQFFAPKPRALMTTTPTDAFTPVSPTNHGANSSWEAPVAERPARLQNLLPPTNMTTAGKSPVATKPDTSALDAQLEMAARIKKEAEVKALLKFLSQPLSR